MLHFSNTSIHQWIIPSVVWFLFIGSAMAVTIGISLILRSPRIFRTFELLNHSVSARRATKFLAIRRDSSRFVWKYRHPIGIFFVFGAVYSLLGLLFGAGNAAIVARLNLKFPTVFVFWIVESLRYFMIVGCTTAIIVGLLMFISPDTLKSVEMIGAQWYSTRKVIKDGDKMHMPLEKWVTTYPRTAGLIIFFPAMVQVMYFGDLLLKWV